MPADRTSVSTGKLCARSEVAIDLMILARSSKGQLPDQEAVAQPARLLLGQPYRRPRCSPTARPLSQLRAAQLPTHAARNRRPLGGRIQAQCSKERAMSMRPAMTEEDAALGTTQMPGTDTSASDA